MFVQQYIFKTFINFFSLSGGFIYHLYHEPLALELTFDYNVFYFVDDSNEKLTLVTTFAGRGLNSVFFILGSVKNLKVRLMLEIR